MLGVERPALRVQRHVAALYYTLLWKYCEEISRTNGKATSRRVRGGAPRAPGAAARCLFLAKRKIICYDISDILGGDKL